MWKKARWIVAFVLMFVLACALVPGGLPIGNIGKDTPTDPARTANAETVEHVPYEVLAPADSMGHAQEIADAYGLQLKSYAYGIAVLIAPNAGEAVELSLQMEQDGIPPLSLNLLYTYSSLDNTYTQERSDTRYNSKNKSNDSEYTETQVGLATGTQWHHDEMDTESAWDDATGEGVVVAVLDTGVDIDHPAFEGRLSELSYNAETDEPGLENVQDTFGHGTHVSGIIAASYSDDDISVYGVAPKAQIMMIKVGDFWIDGAAVLRGINYAIENGADIINMSFGRGYSDGAGYDKLEYEHIKKAVDSGITVVCAAGNDSEDHAGYPAAYDEVIAVAATRQGYEFDDWYSTSNYGPEIDIAAPGGDIYSTNAPGSDIANMYDNQSDFIAISGTSMASPNVAGVAALVLSMNPGLQPNEVRAILCETARDVGELGRDDLFGAGIVNAYAAVLGPDALNDVTFDFNDEGGRDPVVVKVIPGYTLFEPTTPTWAGHAFMGWFDSETDGDFDFTGAIEQDMSIYAQWIDAEPGMYVTEFPDANFRRAVLKMLNEKDGGSRKDSSFVEDDMADIVATTELYVPNLRIKDMTGLEYFTGLLTLNCYGNRLTELDLSANTELLLLDCDINKLTELDLSKNTALEQLFCSDNMLTKLDISNNPELVNIACYRNALTELDVSNCTGLESLSCFGNQLTELDVTKNTELTSLDCSFNQLTELDVTKNTKLSGGESYIYDDEGGVIGIDGYYVGLDCSDNLLTALDVSKNTELQILICNFNQLTELDLSNNTALLWLIIHGNQLTELDLSANSALKVLDCGRNLLTELDVSGNAALVELWCWGDKLTELDLSNNAALEVLVCGNNRLVDLNVSGNAALAILNCSENLLTELNVSGNAALVELDCSLNYLNELDVSGNINLKWLICDYNYMESPDKVIGWESIPALDLGKTFIFDPQCSGAPPSGKDITASFKDPGFLAAVRDLIGKPNGAILDYDVAQIAELHLSSSDIPYSISDLSGIEHFCLLRSLNCSDQQLESLDLSKSTMLVDLNCNSNKLTELDFSNNTELTWLVCNGNNLETLDLSNNNQLLYLDCSVNKLSSLDVSNNPKLVTLCCSENDLDTLDVSNNGALQNLSCNYNQLAALDVSNNPALLSLYCGNNNLDELDVSGNILLQDLNCFANRLTELDVSGNPDLQYLYCSENNLTALDVSNNTALTCLDCMGNYIASIYDVLGWQEIGLVLYDNFYYYSQKVDQVKEILITAHPTSAITVLQGDATASLTITAEFTTQDEYESELEYQWYSNTVAANSGGTLIEGATSATFSVPTPDIGTYYYYCVVSTTAEGVSSIASKVAAVEVIEEWLDGMFAVEFPDANFCSEVLRILNADGKTRTGSSIMTSGDKATLARIWDLNVANKNISDMTGLKHFPELRGLFCYNNKLTTLDLSSNTMLQTVNCSNNKIETLDLSKNIDLENLYCYDNELVGLDVSDNKLLRYLDCSFNRIPSTDDVIGWREQGLALNDTFIFYMQKDAPTPIITITSQPAEITTVPKGSDTYSLSVTAEITIDIPLVYNWFTSESIDATDWTLIEDATSGTYMIPDTLDEGTYYYRCLVSAQWGDAVISDIITVEITPAILESIEVTTMPDKIAYDVDETLDLTGLAVTATYTDDSTADITADITTNPADGATLSTAGTQTVDISYTEGSETKTTSFTVAVGIEPIVLESIEVTSLPTKTVYTEGDALDLAGLVITATYSDGTTAAITTFTTNPGDGTVLNTAGPLTVTISYTENTVTKTTNFNLTVNAAPVILDSIAVTRHVTKAVYTVGDKIDLGGLIVTATYSDGSTAAVTNFTTDVENGTVLNTVGPLTVTVSYTEGGVTKTASFNITVNAAQIVYGVLEQFGTYSGSGDCKAKIDADNTKFVRLMLNGKVVDPSNYEITSGSTVITLKESYLKTLASGTHIFRVEFTDGYAEIKLIIKSSSSNTSSTPKTGDNNGLVLWCSVSTFALIMITCGIVVYRKKTEKSNI